MIWRRSSFTNKERRAEIFDKGDEAMTKKQKKMLIRILLCATAFAAALLVLSLIHIFLYQKGSHLFQYDPLTKESKELLSDVSNFLIYNQADTGFLVSRTDRSTWCYDGDSGSFTKIADAPAVVKGYNSDKHSAYVLREGDLYIWRNGKEELLIKDCDGIEQIAEDGSFYFYREEPVSIPPVSYTHLDVYKRQFLS